MGSFPEGWIAPPVLRETRELVRYRHNLSRLRAGPKPEVHSVLGKEGVIPVLATLWGPHGARKLDETHLGEAYEYRIDSLRGLIEVYDNRVPSTREIPTSP